MKGKAGIAIGIALTVAAFLIGLSGIAVLIGVGEAANNAIAAFAAVSFPFALLAGFFSWIESRAWWAIALALSAPVAVLAILGAWSSPAMIPGALWTVALAFVGAFLGRRLRTSRSGIHEKPPS